MAGYPGLPSRGGHAVPDVRGGRAITGRTPRVVIQNSNAAYNKRAGITPKSPGKGKGKGKVDPNTGMPVMPSEHEMRAEANAQAWKSIQQMQASLPSQSDLMMRYGAQRTALEPLISAHRDWLEKAGQYQVNMTNALSGMVQGAAAAGDATAAGTAAAAGAPLGASNPGNVSPTQAAMPVAAYGTSFANYLHSLVPYASAIGGNAMGQINANEDTDLRTLDASRKEIGLKQGDLAASAYTDISNAAVNRYKSELAMLTAGSKASATAGKDAETKRHHLALEKVASDNSLTTKRRADAAIKLGRDKLAQSGAKGKDGSARTAGDVSGLRGALAKALEMYNKTGGKSTPSRYGVDLTYQPPSDPNNPDNKPALQVMHFTGTTPEGVRKQVREFKAKHDKIAQGPNPAITWQQPKGQVVKPVPGYTAVTGKRGEYNRRQEAWRYLKTVNDNSLHPISTAELQNMWRSMVGAPK